jgi:chemotaxis protein histidine kinase CheA
MERSIKPLLHENPGKGAIVQVVRWEHPPFGRTGVGQVYLIGVGQTPTEAFESAKDAASKGQSIIGAPFPKGLLPDPWGSFRVWYELSGDNLKATIIKQLPGITTFSTAKDLDQVRKDAYNKQKAFADEEERKADALASEAKARADAAAKETAEARARIEKERQEADLREAQHEQELRDLESQRSEQRTREQQARDDRQREAAQTAQRIIDAKEAVELQREKQDNEDAEKHRELEQKELEERQQRDKQEQDARAREQQEQQKKADEAKHIQDLLDNPPTTNPNPKGLTGVPDPGAGGESEPKPLPPNVAPFASTGNKSAFSVMLHNLDVDSSAGVATFIDPQTAKGVSVQFMPTQGRLH